MRLKTVLVLASVVLLGRVPVAYAGSVAPLAVPAAAFSAVGSDRSAATLTFGMNLFGVDGSAASFDFSNLWNGSGDTVDAKNRGAGLTRELMQRSIGRSYGNLEAWGVFPEVPLSSRHFILLPGPRVARLGTLWPRSVQWRKW